MSIEGYTARTSVIQGGSLAFHVDNTAAPDTVRVAVSRIGAPTPLGFSGTFQAGHHPTPPDAYAVGCGWPVAYTLAVPASWPSGVYAATLTNADGDSTEIRFVVRARATARALLCLPVLTAQAYNEWGGNSLYGTPTAERARKVSFDRPGGAPHRPDRLIRWLARKGLAVDVCTGVDLHEIPGLLDPYQLFISSGHDEYWTREMRDAVEGFVERGGNAAFLSGDVCFWQARLEDDGRTLVCYRDAVEDPLLGVDDSRVTTQWASDPVNRPENRMTGVGSRRGAGNWIVEGAWRSAEYRVNFAGHWVFEGTGLADGQTFARGSVGYETDAAEIDVDCSVARATGRDGTPATFVVLAVADLRRWRADGQGGYATMGVYHATGTVFTAASVDWADTLETSPVVAKITENVFTRLSWRYPGEGWERVGDAPDLVAMAAAADRLFAVTRSGALLTRPHVEQNVRWKEAGIAPDVVAMSPSEAVEGRPAGLFLLTADGRLFWREPVVTEVTLVPVGRAREIVSIAAGGVDLFGLTRGGRLVVRPMEGGDVAWQDVGDAAGIALLGAEGRKIWAMTGDGRLLRREPVRRSAPWTPVDAGAQPLTALAGEGGALYGATREGALLRRGAFGRR